MNFRLKLNPAIKMFVDYGRSSRYGGNLWHQEIKKQVIQEIYLLHSDVDNGNHVMAVVINQVENFRRTLKKKEFPQNIFRSFLKKRTFFVGDLGLPKEDELIWATSGPVLSGCRSTSDLKF